jgi:gamma-glutamylcyclotransferase
MSKLYYFAYGSNLHPLRLIKRVPSARFLGLVEVPGYRLCFHKRHNEDQSGKCNMYRTVDGNDHVIGAVYEMLAVEKPLLDKCEGPGYRCDTISLQHQGEQYDCFVYIAEQSHIDDELVPHCWYKNIVLAGAEYHEFPEMYLENIRQVKSGTDPDREQHDRHYQLIEEMKREWS